MAWEFDVPAGQMQSGRWSIRPVIRSVPWQAYPRPEVELSVQTGNGLVLAHISLELTGDTQRFEVPVEFSEPGRYVAVLRCRSRAETLVTISRTLCVVPTGWLQADAKRNTLLARAGVDIDHWDQLTVSGRGAAYGMEGGSAWNPGKQKYGYFEWYHDKAGESEHHIAWSHDVAKGDAGRAHEAVLYICAVWGIARLRVLNADGEALAERTLASGKEFRPERIRFTPVAAGKIRIEISQSGKERKFVKAANCAYVRPVPGR